MMPSECCICAKDLLPNEGGLIYFSEDENDIKDNKNIAHLFSIKLSE